MNVIPIEQNLSDYDRMERFMRTGKRAYDSIPCDVELNNLRPDGTEIVTTEETKGEDA